MKLEHIEFLKSLDPTGDYGTVQGVLLGNNLNEVPFENVAKYLLSAIVAERSSLLKENTIMRRKLTENGLYDNSIVEELYKL